ncbi:hypothetical protein G647_03813 [Cladophialophora carrionii CBS 160.54]|uniref:Uncharacterized protein n=1 Tax=Cladophialophora carrionii CBS 160.54 TaxID=1279043 RepID=V9DC23_9EURO|nr:uncharacterized protein G647_03813 [Cladophialophora carrionii CBS 160.54]ETI24444.1 hypothetical protein G647_03813 [Cladophialophora carrionii CBS 160.54]
MCSLCEARISLCGRLQLQADACPSPTSDGH